MLSSTKTNRSFIGGGHQLRVVAQQLAQSRRPLSLSQPASLACSRL